jgi:hypothetical protein
MDNKAILKFKVWDKLSGYIFFPSSIDFDKELVYEHRGNDFKGNSLYRKHLFSYIDILPYIGFNDKNNNEIYKGDHCKLYDWKPKEIIWKDGRYMLGNTLVICCKMECDEMENIGSKYLFKQQP